MEKTIVATILPLTVRKKEWLDFDYNNYQWWMIFGIDKGLLSGFKAAKGFKQKVVKYKDYPLPLESRFIKDWFRKKDTKLTKDWIKIPNSKRKGQGIWLPLRFHQPFPEKYVLKDSCLILKEGKYYIHFCVDLPECKPYNPSTVLGIDFGVRHPVTISNLIGKRTRYLGKKIKQVRGKYYHLRKKLGKAKIIGKFKSKERHKCNTILHELSKEIVESTSQLNAILVLGKLKNFKKNKGRRFNRKISTFSYYRLSKMIEYKARLKGVPVLYVSEYNTSKTCSVCGNVGSRKGNLFSCSCGHLDNADRNASINIAKRGLSQALRSGVAATALKSLAYSEGISTGHVQPCAVA